MVEVEIDGQKIEADHDAMLIEVADQAGIYIPRFCYHKKLSVVANCRMCLVDVDGVGKPLPACATPVTDGMKVMTKSKKALQAQRIVMEFLLINHPLDCPVCDQGGQCELQDLALGFGEGVSRYTQGKRAVQDKNIGPLIDTEMTRCIHCTRCIRFGEEIAGVRELGMTGRGENAEVGTYIAKLVSSEVSANVIDLCPVGALNAKPSAKQGRAWHFTEHEGVSPHDCLGSNVYWHTDEEGGHQQVVQVVPRVNEGINENWIADRDRFAYLGLGHEERVTEPMIKKRGEWCVVSWQEALTQVVACFKKIIAEDGGAEQLGALASPSMTSESLYMFQKLVRGLGCPNIDHRYRRIDFSDQVADPLQPGLGLDLEDLVDHQALWLVGCDIHRECPILGLRVRQASLSGCEVMAMNTVGYDYHFDMSQHEVVAGQSLTLALARVLVACFVETGAKRAAQDAVLLKGIKEDASSISIAKRLCAGDRVVIWLGLAAGSHRDFSIIHALLARIAELTGASLGQLTHGANSAGASVLGVLPHRGVGGRDVDEMGLHAHAMWHKPRKGYFLLGLEPEFDCIDAGEAMAALQGAKIVVACSAFASARMREYADIILPITTFTEESGSYLNGLGQHQTFRAAGVMPGESRPVWKVMRVLGNLCELPGFDQISVEDVAEEIDTVLAHMNTETVQKPALPEALPAKQSGVYAQVVWPVSSVDVLVRRSQALREAAEGVGNRLRISQVLADELTLADGEMITVTQGDVKATLAIIIDTTLADQDIVIPLGVQQTAGFGMGAGVLSCRGGGVHD